MKKKIVFWIFSVMNIALLVYSVMSKQWFIIPAVLGEWTVVGISSGVVFPSLFNSSDRRAKPVSLTILVSASSSSVALFLIAVKFFLKTIEYWWVDHIIATMVALAAICAWINLVRKSK